MVPGYREDVPYDVVQRATTGEQRSDYWETGAALQATDGLSVSEYAEARAERYIDGRDTVARLEADIEAYHAANPEEEDHHEADIVAVRIAGVLESCSFSLRPAQLMAIHSALFAGVFVPEWVGKPRTQNISKKESVLGGRSVQYADAGMIRAQLDYDFDVERSRPYKLPLDEVQIKRFAGFISNVWQTHSFREGNTRTIAVFSQLYLRSLGIAVSSDPFINNSELYRDALVRANFSDFSLGVSEDHSFIERFYENVALGKHHEIRDEDMNLHGIRIDEDVEYRLRGELTPSGEVIPAS